MDLDGEQIAILHAGDEVTREVKPGHHRLKVHNTLFRKTLDMNLAPGEHATFNVINKAGFGTYSVLAFFLGGGPLYLTLERETVAMADALDPELAVLLTELVEKIGLLRRDMQQKGDLEKYEARIARIEQKFSALAERHLAHRSRSRQGAAHRLAAAGAQPGVPQRRAPEGA